MPVLLESVAVVIRPPADVQRVKPKRGKIDWSELGVWGTFLLALGAIAILTLISAAFWFTAGFIGLL